MSDSKHPYWQHVRKLVRASDGAGVFALAIGDRFLLTVQAGTSWSSQNYEPSGVNYDDIAMYTSYQCVIYEGNVRSDISYNDAATSLMFGEIKPVHDYQFDSVGIRYGALLWDGVSGAMGRRVPRSIIEYICDDLVARTGHVFTDAVPCTKKQVASIKCRSCGDGDLWNGPDFVGDGKYTCYRCRNHPFVALKNVPEDMHDSFKSYYTSIDRHTCR